MALPDVREAVVAVIMPQQDPTDYRDPMPQVQHSRDDGEGGMKNRVKLITAMTSDELERNVNTFLESFDVRDVTVVSVTVFQGGMRSTDSSFAPDFISYEAWIVYSGHFD